MLAEAKVLYSRAVAFLDAAIKADSQRDARAWMGECRECLRTIGQTNGELQASGNVVVQVGVSVERAREAVSVLDAAQALTDAELADRAVRMLEQYNASNPADMRSVGRSPLLIRAGEPDGQAD